MSEMIAKLAYVGARGCDSVQFSQGGGVHEAQALADLGLDYFCGYLGSITPARLQAILAAGMAFMPVTYAEQFDGVRTVAQCEALGLPAGVTVWLDLEGSDLTDAYATAAKINLWARAVTAAGYQPGLYVGAPQPFTAAQLYALGVVRYWRSPAAIPEPQCGYCAIQLWPSVTWAGLLIDIDVVQQDRQGRLPTWAVAAT